MLANAEGATAAVMQYGYQRGKLFEGCEQSADWKRAWLANIFGCWVIREGNSANPVRYWGAIDPGLSVSLNRRGGEKPRGRNW